MIVTLTGHRKLSRREYDTAYSRLFDLLGKVKPALVNDGLALGFDLLGVNVCRELGIPYDAWVPFPEQADRWAPFWQQQHAKALEGAREVHVMCPSYQSNAYFLRDRAMVDHCNAVVAWLDDGRKGSGTGYTVTYADQQKIPTTNLWRV